MSIILNGTTGITTPDITSAAGLDAADLTGTVASARLPAGSVIQVVQSQLSGAVGTTSTSFVTSGLSASITPSSASNKVLVLLNGGGQYGDSTNIKNNHATIYRGGVNLGAGNENSLSRFYLSNSEAAVPHSASILDSPNTTSSTTYTAYFKSTNGNAIYFNVGGDSGVVTLTLMEIAA